MKQEEYRTCMAKGLKGKSGLSKQARQILFCAQSRLCSGKSKTEEEAKTICSQPKVSKQERCVLDVKEKISAGELPSDSNPWAICKASVGDRKTRKPKRGVSCEKNAFKVAECVVTKLTGNNVYKDQALNINSVGAAVSNALIECECPQG